MIRKFIVLPDVSRSCPLILAVSLRLSVILKNLEGRRLKVEWYRLAEFESYIVYAPRAISKSPTPMRFFL
jgi:hypothetical protein